MGTGTSVATAPAHGSSVQLLEPQAKPTPTKSTPPGETSAGHAAPCPVQETIRLVGRKWHLIVLWELSKRAAGFNELKQRAQGISAKMLSQSLNDLEAEALVVRDVITERPLRVMYHLTPKAKELAAIFAVLNDWGERHGVCRDRD